MKPQPKRLQSRASTIRHLTVIETAEIIGGRQDSGAAVCPGPAVCPTDSMTTV